MTAKRTIRSVVMCICILSGVLIAQTFPGAIAGSVADTSGAAVADAVVTIMHKGTGLTRTQNAQTVGDFNFPELPTGVYTVRTTKSGFQAFAQDVEVAVGKISSVPGGVCWFGVPGILPGGAQPSTQLRGGLERGIHAPPGQSVAGRRELFLADIRRFQSRLQPAGPWANDASFSQPTRALADSASLSCSPGPGSTPPPGWLSANLS
jgi:hypothetical protein